MCNSVNQVAQNLLQRGIQIQLTGMYNRETWKTSAVQLESKLPEKLYLRYATFFNATGKWPQT